MIDRSPIRRTVHAARWSPQTAGGALVRCEGEDQTSPQRILCPTEGVAAKTVTAVWISIAVTDVADQPATIRIFEKDDVKGVLEDNFLVK